jgi:hypothetical protein
VRLSLAVAAKQPFDPGPFLRALEAEMVFADPEIDIHIAHNGPWPVHADVPAMDIRRHACSQGISVMKLWGVAIANSTADYVAVLDIQAPPDRGWLVRVKREISNGTSLFFGTVEPGWEPRDRRIVGYLSEYAQFKSPLPAYLDEVPGNNLVCRRDLFAPPEDLLQQGFFKTFMIWRLARDLAVTPQSFGDMPVVYLKQFSLGHYLSRQFANGRCFAAWRHDNPGQPAKLLCVGFTPLLPILRLGRIIRTAKHQPDLRRALFRYFHLICFSEIAWSAGEFIGYLFGAEEACNRLE